MRVLIVLVVLGVLALVAYNSVFFTVDQTQMALVQEFGNIVREIQEPGLYARTPFTQNIVYLDKRILIYDIQPRPLITGDQKRLVIDNYALWRIDDPKLFAVTLGGNIPSAQSRLDDLVYANLRDVLAKQKLEDIVSGKRQAFLKDVARLTQEQVKGFGMKIIDVRIRRADLPQENEDAVFSRMQTERQREAALFRAEGDQQARNIRSQADKERDILLADARQKAEQLKGEGDAQALEVYANAYNRDPEFYRFWRTLQSYKVSFKEGDTIILSTESDYFKFFESLAPKAESKEGK
ncbi:protease modulator HflC [Candidatus Acetothermia bacterium]|nr:protease modulator HflC [Candidatus Acetothermia bacterium]MBI3461007.1 protease modulator HflC [Candidatus Acetothermia bacterium]MBI3659538.1 protease modulator HflC [Candidatus Acetothermia bacterium]